MNLILGLDTHFYFCVLFRWSNEQLNRDLLLSCTNTHSYMCCNKTYVNSNQKGQFVQMEYGTRNLYRIESWNNYTLFSSFEQMSMNNKHRSSNSSEFFFCFFFLVRFPKLIVIIKYWKIKPNKLILFYLTIMIWVSALIIHKP